MRSSRWSARSFWFFITAGILFAFSSMWALAREVPASWGSLVPGPHDVGFRVFSTIDRSRGYWPLIDYRGRANPQPTGRPVQISVWYPALEGEGAEIVTYGDYVALQETALGESHRETLRSAIRRELRDDIFDRYFPPDGPDDAQLDAILGQPAAAVWNAPYREGSFPVVIHTGFGPYAQSVLLEYLASHGYVVMTTHMLGSAPAWFHRGSGTLEWWQQTARDIGYLRGFAAEIPAADPRRTAVIGMTAAAGVLDQMGSMHSAVVVGIEADYPEVLLHAAEYDPPRVRIPVLDIVSRDNTRTREVLQKLVFADRWHVRLTNVEHVDLYQFKRMVDADHALEHRGYVVAARLTRAFLDTHLEEDGDRGGSWLSSPFKEIDAEEVSVERWEAAPALPTEHEFLLLVREGDHVEAARAYRLAARSGHGRFFDADELRTTAIFRLYDDQDPEGAVAALRILVDAYPEDVEGWRYLGRALIALGERDRAREAFERGKELAARIESEEERSRLLERIERDLTRLDDEP